MKNTRVGGWVALALALSLGVASAATISWINPVGGDFSDTGNWQGGVAPGAVDGAVFTNEANYEVLVDASVSNSAAVFNAPSTEVTLNLASGISWSFTNNFYVGSSNQSHASVVVMGGGLVTPKYGKISQGSNSAAQLVIRDATCLFTNTGNTGLDVGCAINNGLSSGTVELATSDSVLIVTNGTGIALGGSGDSSNHSNNYGKLIIRGGVVRTTGLRAPFGATSSADILIETGTLINAGTTAINLGSGFGPGTGRLVMASADAMLVSTAGASTALLMVGDKAGTLGVFQMSNGVAQVNDMNAGNLGVGLVTVENQSVLLVTNAFTIGTITGGMGTVTLSGEAEVMAKNLYVGDNGVGTLTLLGDSTFSVSNNVYVPYNGSSHGLGTGVVVLASPNAILTVSNTMSIGANWASAKSGSGTVILSNGTLRPRVLQVGQAGNGLLTVLDATVQQNGNGTADGLKMGLSQEGGTGIVVLAHANALITMWSNTLLMGSAVNTESQLLISNGNVFVRDVQMGGAANTTSNSVNQITIGDGSLETTNTTFQCSVGRATVSRIHLVHANARLNHPNGVINLGFGTNSYASLVQSNGTFYTKAVNMGGNTAGNPPGQYGEWIIHNATGILRNVNGTGIWLAGQPNCTGLMVLAHAGALVDSTNNILVGDSGDGTLIVSNGLLKAANLTIASVTGSVGRMAVSGGRVEIANTLIVGNRSVGSLNISGGEVLATNLTLVGVATNTTATVEMSGGTLSLYGISSISSFGGVSNLWMSGGTLVALKNFNNNLTTTLTNSPGPGLFTLSTAFTNTQAGVLTGPGGLAKAGAGVLSLTQVNDYTGETVVNAGTLALIGSATIANSTQITVAAGATLDASSPTFITVGGSQTIKGGGTVLGSLINDGTVAPGASPGTLSVVGDYLNNGTLALEIGGTTPGSEHDVLVVATNATVGGTIKVTLVDGFTPATGNSFTVLTAMAVSGTFASTDLPSGDWSVDVQADQVVVNYTGSGGGSAELSVSPTNLIFAATKVGEYSELTFTVNNSGDVQLDGTATVATAGFTIQSGSPFSVAASGSASVTVRFTPTESGSYGGDVTFLSNGGSSINAVSGTGYVQASATNGAITLVSGRPSFGFTLVSGALYRVQASTNLLDGSSWMDVTEYLTNNYPGGLIPAYSETNTATYPRRAYRISSP